MNGLKKNYNQNHANLKLENKIIFLKNLQIVKLK